MTTPNETTATAESERNAKALRNGAILIGVGIAIIVVGVLYVLEAANGPGAGPQTFAERRSYNQTKEAVHGSLPIGLLIAGAGLALAMVGGRMRRVAAPEG